MPAPQTDLPEFENPPLAEVVLGIQFSPLSKFTSIHSGLLWQLFHTEFPSVAENAPLPPTFETFGPPAPGSAIVMPKFEVLTGVPVPRFWFVSADETHIFQIQQDRAIVNWRRRKPQDVYPRFPWLRASLVSCLERLARFLADGNLGELRPNQVELTYINEILLEDGADPRSQLEKVTPLWTGHFSDDGDRKIEDASVNMRYQIAEPGEPPSGRLWVTIQGAFKQPEMKPIVHMQLIARGRPREQTVASALDWMDYGHREIVRGFAAVTNEEMHKNWGRIHVGQ